jgi:hypothetical protein
VPAPEARIKNSTITWGASQKSGWRNDRAAAGFPSPVDSALTFERALAAQRGWRSVAGSANSNLNRNKSLRLAEHLRQTLHWLITLAHPVENEPHVARAGRMHAAVANDICILGSPAFLYCLDFARLRGFLRRQSRQHHADTFAGLSGLWPAQHCTDGYGGQ